MTDRDPTLSRVMDKLDRFLTTDFPNYRVDNEGRLTRIETTISAIKNDGREQHQRLVKVEQSCAKISDSEIPRGDPRNGSRISGLFKAVMPYIGAVLLGAALVGALVGNLLGWSAGD